MKKVLKYYMTLILILPAFITLAQSDDEGSNRGYIVKVGDMAPDFEIEYEDGTKKNLSSFRGKVVMLQFTASWCGVCMKEMPHIESDIWQKHKDRNDFELFGVAYGEGYDRIQFLVSKTKVTYPIVPDRSGEYFHKYAEENAGVTRNIVIGRTGKIIFLTRLFNQREFNAMKKAINNELKKTEHGLQ
ncbi:MAG: TlpA family protein disulfide reductase [Prevotellaceae bacterium]|jgi:peroxiredoxin|nr:TlpA family protein disulfide reductase [Prevotellaceae bacterium]